MDKGGSEGDEILIFACREIGCEIPSSITTIGQLTADLFIQIISKSLALITNDEIKVPAVLPANIAVRHRVCTDIALKIKEQGYLGDCGYNQLLYPVEHQTRDLLKWIVDKLPRSTEEGTEELVGANAILNRNITLTLQKWQKSLWTLPSCQSGKPLTNIYKRIPFSLQTENTLASRLLSKHSLEKVAEHRKAEQLNRKFNNANAPSSSAGNSLIPEDANQLMEKVLASLREVDANSKAQQKKGGSSSLGGDGEKKSSDQGDDENEDSNNANKAAAQMSLSFQELIKQITEESNQHDASDDYRGTRFAHATVFAQEADNGGINAALKGIQDGGDQQQAANNLNNNIKNASSLMANSDAIGADGLPVGNKMVLDRKAQLELEEKQRQEELREIRNEIETLATTLENDMKLEDDLLKVIEESATSLDELNQDVDKLEKECLLRKKVLEMMPSAADNIAKLESICEKASEKLKALEKEWQSVEDPLLKEIAIKENLKIERMNRVSEMIEDIKKYRELMGPMLHDLKERQERAQLLSEERAKLPKNLNRTLYTHRIMDITASLAKQHKEVEKITNDIRDLQKTINLNSNTLQRTDAICEELIFKAASDRNDPVMVDTYRRLKTLRAAFETLIATVNTIGSTEKQTRDFETKIDQEKNRLASYNFDRIQGDLDAITKENQSLLAQVKQLSK